MTEVLSASQYKAMTGRSKGLSGVRRASEMSNSSPRPDSLKRPNHRPKQTPDQMNKTEEAYAREVLEPRRLAGEISEWRFESLKVRLAKKCWYNIDFIVITPDGIEAHEIKGTFVEEDARVKWKAAADLYWWMKFKMIKIKMKNGSIHEMKTEEYKP